ncbi:hypothetical protein OTU49_000542 [Cherax quadricarinatus]|uniref:Uncharacterized protein n=1 Tax=Cherax quadricarinatus TaxID=27406 RepID=A0AAW0XJQ3_CHEQU
MMRERDAMSTSNSAASSSAGGGAVIDSTVVGEDHVPVRGFKDGRKGRSKTRSNDKPKKTRFLSTSSKSLSAIPDRIQLSMLSSGLITITEEDKAIGAIPTKPIDSKDLPKICAQHRQYPILYKVEFQMTITEWFSSRCLMHRTQTTSTLRILTVCSPRRLT